ncbi:hypothetical protein C8Q78DRAFT_1075851 [Trametes maxima]|nr:hypothetical protein C8Q78DRAFT_1075851 [Trametes maxima]
MDAQTMSPAQLATAAEHLMAAKMFSLASCVMLFYDIAITFGDEVEKIWKQRFTGATVLWFLNRYLSPLGYIVIIVSFHDPSWSKATCQRYVLYPEVLKIFTATAVGIIFILRLYSIYSKSNTVLYGFSALLLLELGIKIWAFTDGTMLQLPPGFVGCILTGRSSPGDRIIYTWVAELVFDSVVFFATLYRTIQLYRRTLIGEALSLITVIMRDGIMYFAAIFVSNLVTVLIFVFATQPDLKVINASFSTLITSLMVSRLMLNLRAEVLRRGPVMRGSSGGRYGGMHGTESYQLTTAGDVSGQTFQSSLIGNLGAPIITFEHAGYEDEYEDDNYDDGASGIHRQDSSSSDGNAALSAQFGSREQGRGLNGGSGGGSSSGSLAKKPSLTTSLGPVPGLPKLMGKRRPRTAEGRTPGGDFPDNPAHTRSLPGQVVVQVTEEIIVDDVPDTATHRTPVPVPMPGSPTPPHSPQSPHSRTHPRSPSLSSPSTPPGPWSRPSYPTRPPHSAGAAYPPSTPHAPDSPFAPEQLQPDLSPASPDSPPAPYGQRPPRSARSTQAARRSWAPPPEWRLSLDRDRDAARRPAGGS